MNQYAAAPHVSTTDPSYVDQYQPPQNNQSQNDGDGFTVPATMSAPPNAPNATDPVQNSSEESESLEDQNIFYLLGVTDDAEADKEAFLDELQQVIWEDFLERDAQLLLTKSEYDELQRLLSLEGVAQEERQEQAVVYLEKLIPDLEEVMLEKALTLKADMFKERIAGLREYYADKPEALKGVDEAEVLMRDTKWHQAATKLNSLAS